MPSWNEFITHMGTKEWSVVAIAVAITVYCREGWRLKKLFRRKR